MGALRILSASDEPFPDRREAGRLLGGELMTWRGKGTVVLGIPRGGVIVAEGIAEALGSDLDIILSRKLGLPGNPELAVGAVTEDGRLFADEALLTRLRVGREYLREEQARQLAEIERRASKYRSVRPRVPLAGRTVIVTDDGLATGATMEAALWTAHHEGPGFLIGAVPVAPEETLRRLADRVDLMLCLRAPRQFSAVGQFYKNFDQTDEEEVLTVLQNAFFRGRQKN